MTLLLVEDNRELAGNIIEYLEYQGLDMDYADSGKQGRALLAKNRYALIILDINLPGMDGFSLCRELREQGDNTPVLMLTARDALEDKLEGFQAGADDYLSKPFALAELYARIQARLKLPAKGNNQFRLDDLCVDFAQRFAQRGEKSLKLSPAAWTLLELLVSASPELVSREQLHQALWPDGAPDSDALKVHLHQLRKQIDPPGSDKLIHTLPKLGVALRWTD